MINKLVFEDQITLYWDKEWQLSNDIVYVTTLNGLDQKCSKKTHVTFDGLLPNTEYSIKIERVVENDNFTVLFEGNILTASKRRRLDVTAPPYNAKGDGETYSTEAIQKAVNDCGVGETVYIPKGVYKIGALDLKSDMELYLEEGAILQGTTEVKDYLPKIWSRFEGEELECYRSVINIGVLDNKAGYTTKNVVIRGKGAIVGGGQTLCNNVKAVETELLKEWLENNKELVATCERPDTIPKRRRGRLINVSNCQNVVLSGLKLGMSASWNVHMVYSKDIVTCGCYIFSQGVSNGDGWDPDSSINCVCFNTDFETHDDGIAIKSGKNPEGNLVARPTKDVRVFDCRGRNAVAIGSELSGGIENVFVWDCDYEESALGLNIKTTTKRGGYVKNVKVKNCKMVGIGVRTKYGCNNDGVGSGSLTVIEDICFEDIYFYGRKPNHIIVPDNYRDPIYFDGFDDLPIKNLTLKNIYVQKRPDGEAQDVLIKNVEGLDVDGVKFGD